MWVKNTIGVNGHMNMKMLGRMTEKLTNYTRILHLTIFLCNSKNFNVKSMKKMLM